MAEVLPPNRNHRRIKHQIDAYGVCLRVIARGDLEMVRTWRNDPYIKQFMLSQETISASQQLEWFDSISASETQQHFIINYKSEPIGVINIKSANSDALATAAQVEVGMYIFDERYRANFLAFCPALAINDYCFEQLSCDSLLASVLPVNKAAIKFNTALGYQTIESGELISMTLQKENYVNASKKIKRFIR